jgi:hypothetical protein
MKRALFGVMFAAIGFVSSGCTTMALAPGAEQVKVTRNAADVAGCHAVGNVAVDSNATQHDWDTQLRNKTLGLSGDVLFLTSVLAATEGIAYRCS